MMQKTLAMMSVRLVGLAEGNFVGPAIDDEEFYGR